MACVQEVRDAVTLFREAGSDASATAGGEAKDGRQRKRFTIAVADTFGEGGPVRWLGRVGLSARRVE